MEWEYLLGDYASGETEVKDLFRSLGYRVKDVSKNPSYFYKDIDLIVTNPETAVVKYIEVKADSKMAKTGNIFIELVSNKETARKGWYYYSEADYLYYMDMVNSIIYWCEFEQLRSYLGSRIQEYQVKEAYDFYKDGTIKKVTQGIAVPVSDLPFLNKIYL